MPGSEAKLSDVLTAKTAGQTPHPLAKALTAKQVTAAATKNAAPVAAQVRSQPCSHWLLE